VSELTREEKIVVARWLYGHEDLSMRVIGERLGVSASCVWKWVNPEKAREVARRGNAAPGCQAKKNAWHARAYKDPARRAHCPICGGVAGRFAWDKPPRACRNCRKAQQLSRWIAIEVLWARGLSMHEIGQRLGMSDDFMGKDMADMRAAGRELPYRYGVERRPRNFQVGGRTSR